ncbi:MAG TPA: hypothetical protein VFA45_21960 [Actinomycetes bacterium]|nr:hypothetical protein [Actinomycetes bacterium]
MLAHPEAVQEHHQPTYRVNAIPVGDWPAMVWAGRLAGLRWLRDHGHDTPANRVDVRCLGWDDTAEADRWIRHYDLPDCAGQDLAQQLLDGHWPAVTAVAARLQRARRLDGAAIRQIVAAATGASTTTDAKRRDVVATATSKVSAAGAVEPAARRSTMWVCYDVDLVDLVSVPACPVEPPGGCCGYVAAEGVPAGPRAAAAPAARMAAGPLRGLLVRRHRRHPVGGVVRPAARRLSGRARVGGGRAVGGRDPAAA